MTPFDPLKAAKECMTGLVDVINTLKRRENECEVAMSKAETELNIVRKLRGFCDAEIARQRELIRELEQQQQQKEN